MDEQLPFETLLTSLPTDPGLFTQYPLPQNDSVDGQYFLDNPLNTSLIPSSSTSAMLEHFSLGEDDVNAMLELPFTSNVGVDGPLNDENIWVLPQFSSPDQEAIDLSPPPLPIYQGSLADYQPLYKPNLTDESLDPVASGSSDGKLITSHYAQMDEPNLVANGVMVPTPSEQTLWPAISPSSDMSSILYGPCLFQDVTTLPFAAMQTTHDLGNQDLNNDHAMSLSIPNQLAAMIHDNSVEACQAPQTRDATSSGMFERQLELSPRAEDFYKELERTRSSHQRKGLIDAQQANAIKQALLNPKSSRLRKRASRSRSKEGVFSLKPRPTATDPGQVRICIKTKTVAIKEELFEILTCAHRNVNHMGRDKTYYAALEEYCCLPKFVVALYVKLCPTCQGDPGAGKRPYPSTPRAQRVPRRRELTSLNALTMDKRTESWTGPHLPNSWKFAG